MTAREKLLELENVYDQKGSSDIFMEAMRDCVAHHMKGNEFFRKISNRLINNHFSVDISPDAKNMYKLPNVGAPFVQI